MDDLVSKLQEILGSEEGMQKLKSVASMLGMGENGLPDEKRRETAAPSDGGLDLSALNGLLSGGGASGQDNGKQQGGLPDLGIDINMMLKLQQVMAAFHNEDDNTRFLQALRPLMREDRRHKVDEVLRMMKLFSLLPLLKESGILDNLLKP